MKKYKLIAPLFAMASIATIAIPLTSCNKPENNHGEGWIEYDPEDGPFEPTVEKADPAFMSSADANKNYFEAVNKNPKILPEDFLWSNFGQQQKNDNSQIVSEIVDCEVVDAKKQLFNVKLTSTTFDGETESSGTLNFHNFKFVLMFVKNEAIITPDITYVTTDNDWSFISESREGRLEINKDSELLLKQTLQMIIETQRFKSYYFSDIGPNTTQIDFDVSPAQVISPVTSITLEEIESPFPYMPYYGLLDITWEKTLSDDMEVVLYDNGVEVPQSYTTWHTGVAGISSEGFSGAIIIADQSFITSPNITVTAVKRTQH